MVKRLRGEAASAHVGGMLRQWTRECDALIARCRAGGVPLSDDLPRYADGTPRLDMAGCVLDWLEWLRCHAPRRRAE